MEHEILHENPTVPHAATMVTLSSEAIKHEFHELYTNQILHTRIYKYVFHQAKHMFHTSAKEMLRHECTEVCLLV
jgi:hypothetical protein